MRTNVFVRDMDLGAFNLFDTRRLEVVVEGLPLLGGAQLAVDTTLVCPLTREGEARPRAAIVSGACLTVAGRRKEARYPELVAWWSWLARLACSRWNSPASTKVGGVPQILQGRAHAAWFRR